VLTHGRDPRYNVADILVQQIDSVFRDGGDPVTDAPLYDRLFPFVSPAMDRALRAEPATALSNVS